MFLPQNLVGQRGRGKTEGEKKGMEYFLRYLQIIHKMSKDIELWEQSSQFKKGSSMPKNSKVCLKIVKEEGHENNKKIRNRNANKSSNPENLSTWPNYIFKI